MNLNSYPFSFEGRFIYKYGVLWIDMYEEIDDLQLYDKSQLYCYFSDHDDDYCMFDVRESDG